YAFRGSAARNCPKSLAPGAQGAQKSSKSGVMPHGVLFRGGAEREIRTRMLDEDLLDAVIGLGPNLFYGTGIPACLLVIRAKGAKPKERRGKVLFINADREYLEGRAQNYLQPEHVEKTVSSWRAFADVNGFARAVGREELRENDDNLNIRRYADNAPPAEPHDVRAHVQGGIPKAEVEAKAALFAAHGFDPKRLLRKHPTQPSGKYLDFVVAITEKAELGRRIEADTGVRAREKAVADAVEDWWKKHQKSLAALPETREVTKARAELLASFQKALLPVELLDRFQVAGVVATWWGEVQNDLRTSAARGFLGLVEAWETSILTALDDKRTKENPLDHRLVKRLLPEYLEELGELEAKRAELEATIKGDTASDDEEAGEVDEDAESALSQDELRAQKLELAGVKKALKAAVSAFTERLRQARKELGEAGARDLVLGILRAELDAILERYVVDHRQRVVAAFETWWDKYRTTLAEIEEERDAAAERLRGFLGALGYE
ncbi:MAG: N-6 DNA methylase, partial [Polyangiaceae bacterium]|nr:N-6 DNA methylase [Polyangiaceae bacterium]